VSAEADEIPIDDDDFDDFGVRNKLREPKREDPEIDTQEPVEKEPEICENQTQTDKPEKGRNPARERKRPGYLSDYVCSFDGDEADIDYCYRLVCNVPQTYKEAVTSENAKEWVKAMR